jgi:2-methylfumaryl-CoA hydratase
MTLQLKLSKQEELGPETPVDLGAIASPQYGRYLDDFVPDQVFAHPRGYTFQASEIRAFATTFMQANPIFLNSQYAKAYGFADIPASPQMVFNVVLSLGVHNDSEKAMANLGYYDAQFLRPVYAGDTIRSLTKVLSRKDRGADKPGIAHIQTLGVNQNDEVVLQYERKIMVIWRGDRAPTSPAAADSPAFPWQDDASYDIPFDSNGKAHVLTGGGNYFEDFQPGQVIAHTNGRTITEEHVPWTYRVGNTHPLHYDRVYSKGLSGPMSGEPIVYGGLVFAWLEGLASRDVTENAVWELGFTEGYHTQPAFAGDTVFAISRVLAVDSLKDSATGVGLVSFQLIGVKDIKPLEALDQFGADLFLKENQKRKLGKDKISAKIFEIERRLLIKKRP